MLRKRTVLLATFSSTAGNSGGRGRGGNMSKKVIMRFKNILLLNVLSYFLLIGLGGIVTSVFPHLKEESLVYVIISYLALAYVLVILLMLFFYIYKASKVLKEAGYLKVKPSLILILAILGMPIFIVDIIIFMVLWSKSNAYLKNSNG